MVGKGVHTFAKNIYENVNITFRTGVRTCLIQSRRPSIRTDVDCHVGDIFLISKSGRPTETVLSLTVSRSSKMSFATSKPISSSSPWACVNLLNISVSLSLSFVI